MRFAFTDDQLLFRDTVRDLLTKTCPPDQVRLAWENDDGRLPDVWAALADMGVLGLQVPEAFGGLGLTELDVRLHDAALALLGPAAELEGEAPAAVDGGAWMKGYQFALSGPIYAGTNEIQRNVIAERVLGLPRS